MANTGDKARRAAGITTKEQADALILALGLDPIRVERSNKHSMDLWLIADAFERTGKRGRDELWDAAVAQVACPVYPVLAARVEKLCSVWPRDRAMPGEETLAQIVGGSPAQVRALLDAAALERRG